MTKWIIGVIVIALAGWGLWWWMNSNATPTTQTQTQATSTPVATQPGSGLPTADSNTSDTAVVQDTAAIDAQMASLGSDSASASGSLNDTPVQQSY